VVPVADRIRVLDDATVDKIAAGEVVERPASVVKELIENSLDAGAGSISVSVEDGGRGSVSVKDDGCGMSRDDARAAFQRHATSKISTIEDLRKLSTYGFRGEALASISAVSRVTLRTREHGSDEGTEVSLEGGRVAGVSTVGCPPGTEIIVRDIFYNVPARRKSMKGKSVELAHCLDVVVNYVLTRAGIALSFRSDGDMSLVHSPAEGTKGSLASAFGPRVAENMLAGEVDENGVRVEAYLGRLEHTKSSTGDLRLFVNDRPVRSQKLVSAVLAGYGSKLMKDRYPMGVIRMFADPSDVDFNVHPAKSEVRFCDEHAVVEAVKSCVARAIEGPDLTFQYDLTKFSQSFGPVSGIPDTEMVRTVQAALDVERASDQQPHRPIIVPLAQVMNTYILAESRGNLLLIDQHAAAERVVYESILNSMEAGKEVSQTLLTPLVVHLSSSDQKTLEENRDALETTGFKVEEFGKHAFALRSIPTVLGVAQGESAFRNILGDLANMAPEKKLGLEVIWRVACHTATRAGESLSQAQMRQLISELVATKSPYTCEHGRPTMIVLSPADLEKLFKRRV
jgi:DNA mismatch repair protein MutL